MKEEVVATMNNPQKDNYNLKIYAMLHMNSSLSRIIINSKQRTRDFKGQQNSNIILISK